MRDENRIKPFLAELEKAWLYSPDLRFAQLVINLLGIDSYYMEDEDALKIIQRYNVTNDDEIFKVRCKCESCGKEIKVGVPKKDYYSGDFDCRFGNTCNECVPSDSVTRDGMCESIYLEIEE
jgi:hypothetical protein